MTFFHGRDILGPNVLLADAHGAADFRFQVRDGPHTGYNGKHYITEFQKI